MTGNPMPLMIGDPLQIDDARRACHLLAARRRAARDQLQALQIKLAERERDYRKARALAYVANVDAPSAGMRDAIVDQESADARFDRDLAASMVRAQEELLREIDGERASLHRLIDMSMRISEQLEPPAGRERT